MKIFGKHENAEQPKAPQPVRDRKLGLAALGNSKPAAAAEAFTGGKGSVAELARTLPPLEKGVPARVNLSDIISHDDGHTGRKGLLGIVLAADSAVGIMAQLHSGSNELVVNFVELAYGEHSDGTRRSNTLINIVHPAALNKPGSDGVVQPWETLKFGRGSAREGVNTIGTHDELSREHFSVTVDNKAGISVLDEKSTNGTVLITQDTLIRNADNEQLLSMVSHLSQNHLEWSETGYQHMQIPQPV